MLKQNCCLSGQHFPSPAIVEASKDCVTNYHKVRRLHLIVGRPVAAMEAQHCAGNFGAFLIVMTSIRVNPFPPVLSLHQEDAVDLHVSMLWMAPNALLSGVETDCRTYYWTSTADTLVLAANFFFAGSCLGWSRAERPSVSWTEV